MLEADAGFYFGFGGVFEIGQLENLTFWVEQKGFDSETKEDVEIFYREYEQVNDAIDKFIEIRDSVGCGYDWEKKLNET